MDSEEKLFYWRRDELVRAGYETDHAALLAELKEVDLHKACELLRSGCSPSQAVEILV